MGGIIAAISIPQFTAYRARSFNSASQAALMNAATAQEAYYVDNEIYADSIEKLIGNTYGFSPTEGVEVKIQYANKKHYTMVAFHEKANKKYTINGPDGEIREEP